MSASPVVPNRIGQQRFPQLTNFETGITAHAGGGQTDAYQLTGQYSEISTCASGNDSVKLPKITASPGQLGSVGTILAVTNAAAANAIKIYGANPDTINAVATGTGNAVSAGVMVLLVATGYTSSTDVGTWRMINSTASAVAAFTSGTLDSVAITTSTVDSTVIGGSTPAAATFTDLTSTGNTSIGNGATDLMAVTGLVTMTRSTSSASETKTLSVVDTRTGAGATGWASKFDLEFNVALGSYANAVYAYMAAGASGKVTGLGSASVGEIVLSAGCTDGTYACFEAEMGMPSGAKTGTAASFMYLSSYGADAGTFDTNGYLIQIAGLTKNTGKLYADATTGSTARPVEVLRVLVEGAVRYLPLYSTVAIAA